MNPEQFKEAIQEYLMQCHLDVSVFTHHRDNFIQVTVILSDPEGYELLRGRDSDSLN